MLLALLMLVPGLLGGALGGPPPGAPVALVLEAERDMGGASGGGVLPLAPPPRLSCEAALYSSWTGPGGGTDRGGGPPETDRLGGGVPVGGGGVPETERGPALGGGGAGFLASVFSAPDFLLTHLLRSGS